MRVRKAVLPVAGFGTRVLPATKAIPKEMLPVVDRPAIQYVVDEALEAGIEHIVFVTGRNKGSIEDYFDIPYELEVALEAKGKKAILEQVMPYGVREISSAKSRSPCCCRMFWSRAAPPVSRRWWKPMTRSVGISWP